MVWRMEQWRGWENYKIDNDAGDDGVEGGGVEEVQQPVGAAEAEREKRRP